ncbi:MAG: DEAD/DEAH box helicase [Bdellovibrionales bacterium]
MLNLGQKTAFDYLSGTENVFLTGGAGTGKSFLVKQFLEDKDPKQFPVLASTGSAAVLVGGRTFHSFFNLGIMEGGLEATIEKAIGDSKLVSRLHDVHGFILDEVSMIPAVAFRAAEAIARLVLNPSLPWGGLRVIAVGDFAQLPPVNIHGGQIDWVFKDPSWRASQFKKVVLSENMRSNQDLFLEVLADLRVGNKSEKLLQFLQDHTRLAEESLDAVRLFPRKNKVETYNLEKLEEIEDQPMEFFTEYDGNKKFIEKIKKSAPVPEKLVLKIGAFVMIRQNDPMNRFVNGSLGHIMDIHSDEIDIDLLNGHNIRLERSQFSLLDPDGNIVALARNFPISLAYATTIHKSQGTTLDRMVVDISSLWEPGQAYVALSRIRDPKNLYIEKWDKKSIKVSSEVVEFYKESFGGI